MVIFMKNLLNIVSLLTLHFKHVKDFVLLLACLTPALTSSLCMIHLLALWASVFEYRNKCTFTQPWLLCKGQEESMRWQQHAVDLLATKFDNRNWSLLFRKCAMHVFNHTPGIITNLYWDSWVLLCQSTYILVNMLSVPFFILFLVWQKRINALVYF